MVEIDAISLAKGIGSLLEMGAIADSLPELGTEVGVVDGGALVALGRLTPEERREVGALVKVGVDMIQRIVGAHR